MADETNTTPDQGDVTQAYTAEEQQYKDTRGGEIEPKEPPAKAEPEKTEPEAPETVEPKKDDRKVDYGALAEERGKRKAVEDRLRQAELQQARMEERFRAHFQQQPPPQKPPSPDEDIFGAVNHLVKQTNTLQQRIVEDEQRVARQQAAARQQAELAQWASGAEAEFKKATPDYDDALKYLREGRVRELEQFGYTSDIVRNTLQRDETDLVAQARRAGKNPAELAYQIAKQRGYAAKPPAEDVSKKLDRIEAGQKAGNTLSSLGGKAGGGEMDIVDILKLPEEEFTAWKVKNPAKYRRLLGSAN